jgi:hypothetical protein
VLKVSTPSKILYACNPCAPVTGFISGRTRAKRLHTVTCYHPPCRDGWRDTDWFKRAILVKLIDGLTSSRVLATFALHATLIVHAPTQPNFHVNWWAAGPCELIGAIDGWQNRETVRVGQGFGITNQIVREGSRAVSIA